ncbi:hypothetical protein NL676_018376 [Syzygium grande]|nr:hypothetical protein NL676_018376 [Syzygium grande]
MKWRGFYGGGARKNGPRGWVGVEGGASAVGFGQPIDGCGVMRWAIRVLRSGPIAWGERNASTGNTMSAGGLLTGDEMS